MDAELCFHKLSLHACMYHIHPRYSHAPTNVNVVIPARFLVSFCFPARRQHNINTTATTTITDPHRLGGDSTFISCRNSTFISCRSISSSSSGSPRIRSPRLSAASSWERLNESFRSRYVQRCSQPFQLARLAPCSLSRACACLVASSANLGSSPRLK